MVIYRDMLFSLELSFSIQNNSIFRSDIWKNSILKWKQLQEWRNNSIFHKCWKLRKNGSSFWLTWPGGACIGRFRSFRPRQALITVLWRWRCISASSWFQSLSWAGPFISRPSSWICWTLHNNKDSKLTCYMTTEKKIKALYNSYISRGYSTVMQQLVQEQ